MVPGTLGDLRALAEIRLTAVDLFAARHAGRSHRLCITVADRAPPSRNSPIPQVATEATKNRIIVSSVGGRSSRGLPGRSIFGTPVFNTV
jgi:hypothetical protein